MSSQSCAVSFLCSATSADTIEWKTPTSRSASFLYVKTSCSSFSILASRLPSPLGPRTSSVRSFPSTICDSLGCIFSSSMYGVTTFTKKLSFGGFDEDMAALDLKTISGQKQLETKHDEKARYEPRGFG